MTDERPDQHKPTDTADNDQIVDAGSLDGVRKQSKRRKRQESRVADFWKASLSDEVGRSQIWDLLTEGGAFQPPFAVGPTGFPQPEASWFKAGQQALVLGLYHRLLAYDFDGVKLMLSEHDPRFKALARG